MKINNFCSVRSRREFIKRFSTTAMASSLVVIDSPSLSAQGNNSEKKTNPAESDSQARLNCAETILSRANEGYQLGLTPENQAFAATFGGGMGIGDTCGAVSGSLMILGYLFRPPTGRDSPARKISVEFLETFRKRMDSLDCRDLRLAYRTEEAGCEFIISTAMEVLEASIKFNEEKRIR